MTDVELNGTTLYYTTTGEGPTALVMHGGLGIDHTSCRGLDILADRLKLVYYDHRANGRSGRPPLETLTMEQLADDAAELAKHLGGEPVIVIGHSFGGYVAQELAVRHPDLVKALILIDTTAGMPGANEDPASLRIPPPPPELMAVAQNIPMTNEAMMELQPKMLPFYVHSMDPTVLIEAMAETIFNAEVGLASLHLQFQWSIVDRLPQIKAPTLAMVGEYDLVVPPVHTRRIANAIPGSRLVEFTNSGHFPWLEEPELFNQEVKAFLAQLDHPAT